MFNTHELVDLKLLAWYSRLDGLCTEINFEQWHLFRIWASATKAETQLSKSSNLSLESGIHLVVIVETISQKKRKG